jgi:hypothetical protein
MGKFWRYWSRLRFRCVVAVFFFTSWILGWLRSRIASHDRSFKEVSFFRRDSFVVAMRGSILDCYSLAYSFYSSRTDINVIAPHPSFFYPFSSPSFQKTCRL